MSNNSDAATAYAAMAAMLDNECRISMLWNWHTVDACFLSSRLRITSPAVFGFSCVAVVVLVMSLEGLRRLGRLYDDYVFSLPPNAVHAADKGVSPLFADDAKAKEEEEGGASLSPTSSDGGAAGELARQRQRQPRTLVRPTFFQQMLRTLFYTLQFAIGYLVMLLAMSHNGYILICIFIGAFLGFAIFSWEGRPSQDGIRCAGCA